MSDSVKKWHEMQEEKLHFLNLADEAMAKQGIGQENKKAYKILLDYDVEDIKKALEIYNKTK